MAQMAAGLALAVGAFLPIGDDGAPYRSAFYFYQVGGWRYVLIFSCPLVFAGISVQYPNHVTRALCSWVSIPIAAFAWFYTLLHGGPFFAGSNTTTMYGRYVVEYACYALVALSIGQLIGTASSKKDAG
jgi:hypothetical protein